MMSTKGKTKKLEKLWLHHRKLFREVGFELQCLHHILKQLCEGFRTITCTLALDGFGRNNLLASPR